MPLGEKPITRRAAASPAIANGADILATYRIASLSAARNFGLFDRGFIGPGKRADIVLVEDLAACSVKQVLTGGRLVEDGLFEGR
ncbi:MAG: amidohydrolase family protein, partial [Rhizobiales bacterium]|nr:amidohydrolase family protein [Hyphomicrobiales bacterium]